MAGRGRMSVAGAAATQAFILVLLNPSRILQRSAAAGFRRLIGLGTVGSKTLERSLARLSLACAA